MADLLAQKEPSEKAPVVATVKIRTGPESGGDFSLARVFSNGRGC